MRTFGLIGFPLSHSFSKKYFTEKFKEEGIDAVFNNYSIETLETLTGIVEEQQLDGFAITIPHKRSILPFLYRKSDAVEAMGACNCVLIKDLKWYGYNTDVLGFERSFLPLIEPHHTKALVLGTGGAASAVEFTLKKLGIFYKYVSRTKKQDNLTYDELDATLMDEYKVIINCSPVGTYPNTGEAPFIPYQFITPAHYLFDLVYNPEVTLFLQKGKEQGATIKNGYEMLVLQAEENWKIWNG
jgi:shikimate dehydrogenase